MESKINYVSLNEISTIQTGKKDANYGDKGGEYPFFTCADKPILSPTYSFDGESIILPGNGANVGMVFYHVGKFEAYQRTYVLNNIKCNSRYLFHHLSAYWKKFNLSKQFGSATNYIRMQNFLDYTIPLPPIASQRTIANILDKADEIIRKRKEAIALTEQLQKSIFLDMFGDPVINPKGWEKVTLGSQILNFKYGTNSKCHDTKETEDLPVLRIPNIIEEKILWEDLKFATVSHKEKQDLLLRENDLLFVRSNGNPEYIGRCALFESSEQVIYASYLIRGRLKSTSIIKAGFVRDIISFPTYRSVLIKQARTTAGNYNINTQGLKSLEIIKPSVEEQEKYLSITKSINKSITTYYKSLQESENLFNSLLQKAFKGEL
jgi:type I restriction enzyme S subunit